MGSKLIGGLAQLARALPWHGRGHRFESDILQEIPSRRWDFFMCFIYILYSKHLDRYYVGQTDDIEKRLQSHLSGISKYTSVAKNWTVVYSEYSPLNLIELR